MPRPNSYELISRNCMDSFPRSVLPKAEQAAHVQNLKPVGGQRVAVGWEGNKTTGLGREVGAPSSVFAHTRPISVLLQTKAGGEVGQGSGLRLGIGS